MLKKVRFAFQIALIGFAAYVAWSEAFALLPYVLLLLAISLLWSGVEEIRKDRKGFNGYMFVGVSLWIFFVSGYSIRV